MHETAVILKAAPANTLPDKKAYNPKSLNKVLPLLEDRISQYSKEDFYKRLEQDGEYENGEEVEIDGEKFKVHTIDEKDSRGLSFISKRYYGTANKWRKIYDANRSVIIDFNKIYIGQKILIPI